MQTTPKSNAFKITDLPFYKRQSRKALAKILNTSPHTLDDLSKRDILYTRRWKHKKEEIWLREEPEPEVSGNYRPIDIPDPQLKNIQARIAYLLGRVTPPSFLFSPVKGRSYVDNAACHLGAKAFWLLDIADYFPSCSANNVARFFKGDLLCSSDVTAVMTRLTTHNQCLPQGSPCSPILAYFSNHRMWHDIERLAREANCTLSVYADDITISGQMVRKKLIWDIKRVIHRHGLKLKSSKEVSLILSPADITGVIVREGKTKLPNRQHKKLAELKKIRALATNTKLKKKLDNQIKGRKAQRKQVERS